MASRKRCTSKTKAGKRCQAWPLHGTERCAAHPVSPDSARFGSPEQAAAAGQLGGRPRLPKPHERMREKIEAELDAILAPYFDQIRDAVVVVKYEGEAIASDVADTGARIAAAERLLDRVYGKPAQAVELSGPAGAPVAAEVVRVDDKEVADAAHEFLTRIAGSG